MVNTKKKHHSIRLKDFDYASEGAYFITICIRNHVDLLGNFVGTGPRACPELVLSDAGKVITETWEQIPKYYHSIETDEFVVMPNHIHEIVFISHPNGQPQGVAPTKLSLSDVVHRFKTMTTKRYSDGVKQLDWKPYYNTFWQRNYYEHVIRDVDESNLIREYIIYNPLFSYL